MLTCLGVWDAAETEAHDGYPHEHYPEPSVWKPPTTPRTRITHVAIVAAAIETP